jgi:hypothetical protein
LPNVCVGFQIARLYCLLRSLPDKSATINLPYWSTGLTGGRLAQRWRSRTR